MDLVQSMRVFVRVAQLSGFSATARQLGISTAAVTKHVAEFVVKCCQVVNNANDL